MFKSLRKRLLPSSGDDSNTTGMPQSENSRLVSRIMSGDADAEMEFVKRFRDPVLHIIRRIAKNIPLADDFAQETFLTLIRKIRNGDVQQPESLGAFVANTARFHALEQLRKLRSRAVNEDLDSAEDVPDPGLNGLQELERAEQGAEIRTVMDELIPRYKELLLRFYLNEEDKESICADLNLTSAQFDGVLHRARNRYRTLYLERKSRP